MATAALLEPTREQDAPDDDYLYQKLRRPVDFWMNKGDKLFSHSSSDGIARPRIRFCVSTRNALQAVFPDYEAPYLQANPVLVEVNPCRAIQRDIPRECAHLVAYHLHGRRCAPHDRTLIRVLRYFGRGMSGDVLGLECLDEPDENRAYPHSCRCPRRIHWLTERRPMSPRFGARLNRCRDCGEEYERIDDLKAWGDRYWLPLATGSIA